jgi:peptidoglycan-associated lipoprotein
MPSDAMREKKQSFKRQLLMPVSILVLGVFLVSGCGKKKLESENVSSSIKPEGHQIQTSGHDTGLQNEGFGEGELETLDQSTGYFLSKNPESEEYKALYGRSTAPLHPVYFNFDSGSIKPDQFDNLAGSGSYLLENKSGNLVVEGNCDERGTADYNLALGEVRAMNVKKHLVTLGVAEQRISTVSFGSERPLYPGSYEAHWSQNRRADLVLPK